MTAYVFVDTNILVYAVDASEPRKQPVAKRWIDALWRQQAGRLSIQVLNEYYDIVTRKLDPGLTREQAQRDVRALSAWRPLFIRPSLLEAAWKLQDRFSLAWWDSLIVAAAQRARCQSLLSEDLQDGADYGGVRVVDPFRHPLPDEIAGS